jgi:prevent-host-death family protein
MASRIPEILPVGDLASDPERVVERARQRQEPVVITEHGRDAAVLVPIELYRRMEQQIAHNVTSPRLLNPEDAARFTMTMTVEESAEPKRSA